MKQALNDAINKTHHWNETPTHHGSGKPDRFFVLKGQRNTFTS